MSRIGYMPVTVPSGVSVEQKDNQLIVKGNKGELSQPISDNITVKITDGVITFDRKSNEKKARSEHGLMRSLTQNMIDGVSQGFKKQLEVNGVGFKINLSGKNLKLALGYSHDVLYVIPEGIDATVEENVITISGANKQQVGQTAAEIRKLRKPEPYKGKGIKYIDEYIVRKSGKTAAGGEE